MAARAPTAARAATGSYGSTGSHGSTGGHVIYSHAATTVAKPVVVATAKKSSGTLNVRVPVNAVVFVNDHKTTSTGSTRNYVSHGLTQGKSYEYRVRVEYTRDGQTVTESKVAQIVGGGSADLAFGAAEVVASTPAETKLTLSVPADAKVSLAGMPTTQSGAEREYLTTRLAEGESWDAYRVAVSAGGQTQERTITLVGGESQHLVFDFDATKVAAR